MNALDVLGQKVLRKHLVSPDSSTFYTFSLLRT